MKQKKGKELVVVKEEDCQILEAADNLCFLNRKAISEGEASELQKLMAQTRKRGPPAGDSEHAKFPPPALRDVVNVELARWSKPFKKKLTSSDAKEAQSRLLIHRSDVKNHIEPLLGDPVGTTFKFYDGEGIEYHLNYKRWGSDVRVFNGGWNAFMHRNHLKEGDTVVIWPLLFKGTGSPGGVIIPLPPPSTTTLTPSPSN